MATELPGLDIIVRLREAGDTDWKKFVCEIDSQFQHSNDVSETDTKCGPFSAVKLMKGNYSGNAVYNVIPDSDQVSYDDVINWQKNRTPLEMLIENDAYTGEDGTSVAQAQVLHIFAKGRFVDTTLNGATGEVAKFSWTYKPSATPTISGSSS